jgi:hypothetical protein
MFFEIYVFFTYLVLHRNPTGVSLWMEVSAVFR